MQKKNNNNKNYKYLQLPEDVSLSEEVPKKKKK